MDAPLEQLHVSQLGEGQSWANARNTPVVRFSATLGLLGKGVREGFLDEEPWRTRRLSDFISFFTEMKHPTQMSSGDPDFQLTEEESLRPYCTPLPQPLVCCWDHSGPRVNFLFPQKPAHCERGQAQGPPSAPA